MQYALPIPVVMFVVSFLFVKRNNASLFDRDGAIYCKNTQLQAKFSLWAPCLQMKFLYLLVRIFLNIIFPISFFQMKIQHLHLDKIYIT